jgi:hypothetical protein
MDVFMEKRHAAITIALLGEKQEVLSSPHIGVEARKEKGQGEGAKPPSRSFFVATSWPCESHI